MPGIPPWLPFWGAWYRLCPTWAQGEADHVLHAWTCSWLDKLQCCRLYWVAAWTLQTRWRQPAARVGEGICSGMEILTGLLDIPSKSLWSKGAIAARWDHSLPHTVSFSKKPFFSRQDKKGFLWGLQTWLCKMGGTVPPWAVGIFHRRWWCLRNGRV